MSKIIWTEEKINYLKNNYNKHSAKEIALTLNCTAASVFQKAFKLKLKGRPNGSWNQEIHGILTKEDINFLLANYENYGAKYCSKKLNKKVCTIISNANKLNLKVNLSISRKNNLELCIYSKNHANKYLKVFQKSGEENPNWKGGITVLSEGLRRTLKYKKWRISVFERDNYLCTKCFSDKNLHAHHVYSLKLLLKDFSKIINKNIINFTIEDYNSEFFYDINNGLTLCEECHKKWHKEHGR